MAMNREYYWALFTLIAAIVLATILVTILREDRGVPQVQLYAGIPLDEHFLPMDRKALDEAYNAQALLLFSVWLKSQAGDPTYFNNGMKIARRAYHEALLKLDERKRLIDQHYKEHPSGEQ